MRTGHSGQEPTPPILVNLRTRIERNGSMSLSSFGPASRIVRTWTAALVTVWLVVAMLLTLTAAPPVRAGALTTADPAEAAGGWIAQQVETDATLGPGSLADAILALAATGVGQDAAANALERLEAGLDAYILDGTELRPGAIAKAMLAVSVQGADVNSFGERNLEADLRGLLIGTGPDAGRFGSAGILDQALAIIALARTSGGVPASAADWLAAAQCPSGEYSWDGSCPAAPGSEDPDTTAFALQALLAAGQTTAAANATTWLLSLQAADGSLASFGIPNTNSTGVAGQALRAAGQTAAADAAASFVVSLQLGCDADAASIGAIAWSEADHGFLIFSTPQAVLALAAPPMHALSAAGAAADAPVLECATGGPSAAPSVSAAPSTAPSPTSSADPTDAALPDTATGEAAGPMPFAGLVLAVLWVVAVAVLLRRRLQN